MKSKHMAKTAILVAPTIIFATLMASLNFVNHFYNDGPLALQAQAINGANIGLIIGIVGLILHQLIVANIDKKDEEPSFYHFLDSEPLKPTGYFDNPDYNVWRK